MRRVSSWVLEVAAARCFHDAALVEVAPTQTQRSAVETEPLRLISAADPAKAIGKVQVPAEEENTEPFAVEQAAVPALAVVQIWVPSAKRT